MTDSFQLPPLLYILCAMSAIAFVTSVSLWMWNAYRTESNLSSDFSSAIWQGQKYSIFVVMIISIVFALYNFWLSKAVPYILGEMMILLIGGYLAYNREGLLLHIKKMLAFGCLCLIGWGLTIAVGYVLGVFLSFIPTFSDQDFGIVIVFITGLLWNMPTLYWGRKILRDAPKIPVLKGRSPYTYLWPVMLAYLVLLVPLLAQMVVNSEEWQDFQKPKAVKHVDTQNILPHLLYKI